jgi:hypothetical protein
MIKKVILVAAFSLAPLSMAYADDATTRPTTVERRTEIVLNPAALALASLGGELMFKVADRIALVVPVYGSFWYFGSESGSFNWWSIGAGIGARFFLSDSAFKSGWYVETAAQVGYGQLNGSVSSFVLNPYVIGGYGWVWDSGLALNLGLGLQYTYRSASVSNSPTWWSYPFPAAEISLGYAF